ncbi:hypothetical protein K458DRAFT_436091 [Lentithecium fluviatile CBS 122367]|uniref:Uncharacterized protein n=1 Tax=Lentithecium fluviatile CBS 122367 TaxID=1168545 RepID=A0A6G1IIY9_9PLEO|nr:hypothetical protein K458DRAFT_436091 [Lentithecium fluviatile CBS 122367]
MKRKFSFNLPPVKVPLRSDSHSKQSAEPTPSKASASSHRRHISRDSIPSLDSPYICRRPLDPQTEQELRVACALILKNFRPSDADFADADPKLDFSGPHKPKTQKAEAPVRVHRPTGAPAEHQNAKRHNTKPDVATVKGPTDHPMRANTGRRRTENDAHKDLERKKHPKSPTTEAPRSATIRTDIDSDDARSLGTPLTASTDPQLNNASTAPTSVAVTSGKSSKRTSRQYETAAAAADAQATEWMRQELEKRRHQQPPQTRPRTSHRPPSRASSIKAGIKEYMFPGSSTLSRSQSRDSLRTMDSRSSGQPKRSGSSHGWRSWGLQRKSSSRTSSRPGTSGGRSERHEQEKKPELNLNRELPPLPSLDTWTEPEPPKERRKSQQQGAHIATLMRSQADQQQEYAAAVRRHHRRSGSDSMALRYANAHAQASAQDNLKSPTQAPSVEKRSVQTPAINMSMDFDQMMSAMSSNRHLDDQLALRPNTSAHVPRRSTSTISQSGKPSTDGRLHAPNFSRKISTDVPPPSRPVDKDMTPYSNVVQISGPTGKEEQKSKLRRVFSGWMLRKEKKEDWMGKFEKQGIRNGVMVQEEAALPPVVRY